VNPDAVTRLRGFFPPFGSRLPAPRPMPATSAAPLPGGLEQSTTKATTLRDYGSQEHQAFVIAFECLGILDETRVTRIK